MQSDKLCGDNHNMPFRATNIRLNSFEDDGKLSPRSIGSTRKILEYWKSTEQPKVPTSVNQDRIFVYYFNYVCE